MFNLCSFDFQDRMGETEKKYLEQLNHYSNRLRLAAAIQADVLPQKVILL